MSEHLLSEDSRGLDWIRSFPWMAGTRGTFFFATHGGFGMDDQDQMHLLSEWESLRLCGELYPVPIFGDITNSCHAMILCRTSPPLKPKLRKRQISPKKYQNGPSRRSSIRPENSPRFELPWTPCERTFKGSSRRNELQPLKS